MEGARVRVPVARGAGGGERQIDDPAARAAAAAVLCTLTEHVADKEPP